MVGPRSRVLLRPPLGVNQFKNTLHSYSGEVETGQNKKERKTYKNYIYIHTANLKNALGMQCCDFLTRTSKGFQSFVRQVSSMHESCSRPFPPSILTCGMIHCTTD
jgi:hypothetical protein